jgi:hypothetical protein
MYYKCNNNNDKNKRKYLFSILPRFTTTVCNGGDVGGADFRNRRKRRIIIYNY